MTDGSFDLKIPTRDPIVIHELLGYDEQDQEVVPLYGDPLSLWNPITGTVAVLSPRAWDAYQSGRLMSDTSQHQIRSRLAKDGFIPKNDTYIEITQPKPNSIEVYVEMTTACNLACPGCAVGSDRLLPHMIRTMTIQDIQWYLDQLIRSAKEKAIQEIHIKWAGGEPLLTKAFLLMQASQRYIQELKEKEPTIIIRQTILTNGVLLTEEHCRFIQRYDIAIAVSLWGIGDMQDLARHPRNTAIKTFPRIIQSLKMLHTYGIPYNIITVITQDNAAHMAEFIRYFWDIHHADYIYADAPECERICIPIQWNVFRPQTDEQMDEQTQWKNMIPGIRNGFREILRLIQNGVAIPPLDVFDKLRLFEPCISPCGTGYNYIAIGPEGFSSCHEQLSPAPYTKQDTDRHTMLDLIQTHGPAPSINSSIPLHTIHDILRIHGGSGCPRQQAQNSILNLYAEIYKELIALEIYRKMQYQR